MDRFFSKLDLRDIKIDPEAKFPPDDEAYVDDEVTAPELNGHTGEHHVVAAVAAVTEGGVATQVQQRNGEVLKVSARSRPSAVAGATNQAVKAVAIARDYLLETGIEAICLPAFIDVTIDDEDRTAIRLIVEPR